jgi:hypothetical protein
MDNVRTPSNSEKNQRFQGLQADVYDRLLMVTGDHQNFSVTVYDTKYKKKNYYQI